MTATLDTAFDEFLYTPIADDAAGMPLTVLSTLARLDLDPWDEAATLFRLSQESATERLTSLLAVPATGSTPHADSATTATRLVKLLKHPSAKRIRSPAGAPPGVMETPAKRVSTNVYYLLAVILMLIGLWAMAVGQPQVQTHTGPAPASPAS